MIHKYKLNGYNMVLDVNSGALHVLDNCSYDILDFVETQHKSIEQLTESEKKEVEQEFKKLSDKYPLEAMEECYSELVELVDKGVLFSEDIDYTHIAETANKSLIKSMCLNVAHDCNLRCEYCFAAKGNFGGETMLMPFEIGKKAIDFLIKESGAIHNLEVDFFGGEPLLNFDVIKQIVEYARSIEKEYDKNFRFTITTNGLLLTDDKIEYINKEMSNCVLSLDGRKEVNDRLRVRADGTGSYDAIVPKFQKLVKNRSKDKDYYIRGTFTKYNLDFANDVLHFADLGFDQLSIEPVVSDPKLDYSIKEEDLPRVFEEYDKLAKIIVERKKEGIGFNFFHFMIDLDHAPCIYKRFKGCGCGNEYVAVTPNGEIYPCHQFVGQDNWKIGDLNDGSFSKEMKFYFAQTNILNKSDCKNCFAKYYCSGGCNANNYTYEGSIFKSHELSCKLQRKRLECALMIKAALAE